MVHPMAKRTMGSLRSFHSTPYRTAPSSREALGNAFPALFGSASSSTSSASSSSSSTHNDARSMIDSIGTRDKSAIDDGRKQFQPNQFAPPHAFSAENLYPTKRFTPREPLLGPPVRVAKRIDPFLLRESNPLDHAVNPHMSYAFVNQMGKIKSRAETGLSWKSQRLVGKMVRRARAMGVVPRWSNVPRPNGLGFGDWDFRRRY